MPKIYRTDVPNVMHEMIDDEVVVVNLDSGTYYSFGASGARIWSLFGGQGLALDQLVDILAEQYEEDKATIAAATDAFISQLVEEGIIGVTDGESPDHAPAGNAPPGSPFTLPVLNKYTDMEALLLADPIHEVTDEGWPNLN